MKITIPAGSILALPKGNTRDVPMTNDRTLVVDSKDVEISVSWGDYIKSFEPEEKRD